MDVQYYLHRIFFLNERTCRDGNPIKATKQGTTPQCFYGLPSLHLWTFNFPTNISWNLLCAVTGCKLRCGVFIKSIASGLLKNIMLLIEGSTYFKVWNGRYHRRRNQGVSLQSGSFSVDQFYESIVCMREIEVVCILNSCNRLLLLVVVVGDVV